MKYLVNLTKVLGTEGVLHWNEAFNTLEEAQARIAEANAEGSDISADTNIVEDTEE